MHTKSLIPLVTLLLLGGAAHAQSHDHKWYVGLDVGQSTLDHDNFAGATELDDQDTTYAVRLGYRFVPWFALEGGYADIGDFSARIRIACPAIPGAVCSDIVETTSIHGFMVNAVGIWPVTDHFQLNASLGGIYRELSASAGQTPANTTRWTDKDTVARIGLGAALTFDERFEIGLDYVQYRDIGLALDMGSNATVVNDGESTVLSLGLRWRF